MKDIFSVITFDEEFEETFTNNDPFVNTGEIIEASIISDRYGSYAVVSHKFFKYMSEFYGNCWRLLSADGEIFTPIDEDFQDFYEDF